MSKIQLKPVMLMMGCLFSLCCASQGLDPTRVKGQLKVLNNTSSFIIPGASSTLSHELRSGIEKLRDIALLDSLLNSPVGFSVIVNMFADQPSQEIPWQKQYSGSLFFDLHDLYRDEASNSIKTSEEYAASVNIHVNSFSDLYPDTYSNDVAGVDFIVPIFFFKYSIKQTDSTKNFIELELMGGHQARAMVNDRQVFVPLRKEQWLTYKIAVDKKELKNASDNYKNDEASVNSVKQHLQSAQKEPVKTDFVKMQMTNDSALLKNYQQLNLLEADKKLEDVWTQKLSTHTSQLNSLSEKEKIAPTYVLWNVIPESSQAASLEELTTKEDPAAQELWTINPEYFNKAHSLASIQLITVSPAYHPQLTSAFLKQKLMDIFESLDYEKLKALIQQ
ncbi:MAG: hypothetical protein ACJ75B_16955 [Flavisolibacter sp.]